MGQKIIVGPGINRGLRKDVTPFNMDNDSFPTLINAYQWRGRVKRKRGTSLLNRLQREIDTESAGVSGASPWTFNLFTVTGITQETNASIVPGSVEIFFTPTTITGNIVAPGYTIASDCEVTTNTTTGLFTGAQVSISGVNVVPGSGPNLINGGPYRIELINATHFKLGVDSHTWGTWASGGTWSSITGALLVFTDQGDGTLTSPTPGNSGTINYATGNITLITTAPAGTAVDVTFNYYPALPVMGLEDLILDPTQFPGTIAFDTKYSYNIVTADPYPIYDVNFYKNPPSGTYVGYVAKATPTPFTWNGKDYQQFWTTNYENSFWATNGIQVPFNQNNVGMQFKTITGVIIGAVGPPALANLTIVGHGLIVGDFVFINEVGGITGINFQTGYVTVVVNANTVTVEFPNATLGGAYTSGGIAQYLTTNSDPTKDCIRYYTGDPTFGSGEGWVNFMPPLSQSNFSVGGLPAAIYYLVTARMIVAFKDRLLFLGPVVQTSGGGVFYLQDTIIYSQNGTPYYTASFTGSVVAANTVFSPLLVPANQTATANSYFEDQTGFGGFISAGISQPITTSSLNEDVLIVGFSFSKTKLVYTGNDLIPFNFFAINSELGDASTFSVINMDEGVISRGTRGYIICSQTRAQRIDLEIPDQVFEIDLTNNGNERFCATRDFINEWIYFTYNSNSNDFTYPNQTLFYNYRDNSWAIFNESYTCYGAFRRQTGFTWNTVGLIYPTWDDWNDPWDAGESTLLQQEVIAGNQQGFVIFRDEGTGEGTSLYISAIDGTTNTITSPNHNLAQGQWIIITRALGTIAPFVNGNIFQVKTRTTDTFTVTEPLFGVQTYLGEGLITLAYVPKIQTKQFPIAWDMARKTRLGPQQYLFTTTSNAQVTLQIFLSQNAVSAYNSPNILPNPATNDTGLIYSQVLYTCPETTNIGLTLANSNLNISTSPQQAQTWHRMNTSLIGDTVQIGFTLSDKQMMDLEPDGVFFTITNITAANPCVITCSNTISTGHVVRIDSVVGMTQLNGNEYNVISANSTSVTLNLDSSTFDPYISGGTITVVTGVNAFAEIELHSFILDVNPSQMLV